MHKNILIISSNITGHGHKSIADSLLEHFRDYPGVQAKAVEGFSLGGVVGMKIGKMYGSITRTSKETWGLIWDITEKRPALTVDMIEATITERLIRLLNDTKPDAIVVTHPNFNAAVTNILERLKLDIPLFAVVADPVNISSLWCNPKATWTICPTEEARISCVSRGVPEERIRVFGFPVRKRFCEHLTATDDTGCRNVHLQLTDGSGSANRAGVSMPVFPLRFLIMSGGEGSGNMSRLANILLKNFDCTVRLLCGRNKLLKKRLEHTLAAKYQDRVEILGFTENVQDLMLSSDILLSRGSPNTIMEAAMCGIPLVITGALPGQEKGNPDYVLKHGLGVVCMKPSSLKDTISGLLANNFERLLEIKKSQTQFRNPNSARDIVDFILNH